MRHFDGVTFDRANDGPRLSGQLEAVQTLMRDGQWRTLYEITKSLGIPEQSASARLRDLRKERFGGHRVDRRRVKDTGTWQYRLVGMEARA